MARSAFVAPCTRSYFYNPYAQADLVEAGGLLDLSPYVLNSSALNWLGIHPFFRDTSASFNGKLLGVPVATAVPLLYYRCGTGGSSSAVSGFNALQRGSLEIQPRGKACVGSSVRLPGHSEWGWRWI
jgi:hypothetical protein